MKKTCFSLLVLFGFIACSSDESTPIIPIPTPTPTESMYFPPIGSSTWETKSIASQGWNQSAVQPLKDYLELKHTKSFMILVNGRIVMEEYINGHDANATWQWNSAGKTLVSSLTGIAQEEGLLNINDKVSDYIGTGWTSAPLAKENLITNKHLLSMTSGIDDSQGELTNPGNLQYLTDAGTRWAYHNIFQKLMDVVASASGQTYDTYFNAKIKNKIGMDGFWNHGIIFRIYHSTTRSMARFGLLSLNKGKWNSQQIIPSAYFSTAITPSQNINNSYGYLWWLNGKSSYMVPGSQMVYSTALVSNAPADMYAAMGAEDQRIYVIPSKKMIVIRMGDASDPLNPNFAVSGFDNELWQKINAVIN